MYVDLPFETCQLLKIVRSADSEFDENEKSDNLNWILFKQNISGYDSNRFTRTLWYTSTCIL